MNRSVIVLVGLAVVLAGLAVPVVLAGDSPAVVEVDPSEVNATAGETVTVDIQVTSHGGSAGEGVVELVLGLGVAAELVTITDVTHGPFMTEHASATDPIENGTVTITQSLESGSEGVTGSATAATVTLAVAEEAPPSVATLEIENTSIQLAGDYPQFSIDRDGAVIIDGGGDDLVDADDDPDGVTLAENSSDSADEPANGTAESDDDAIPTVGLLGAIFALAIGSQLARD